MQTPTSELDALLKDGADLQTTVIDFGEAVIKRVVRGDLCMLTVSGIYTRALGKKLERICLQCHSNLGLEFTDIKVNPALHKKFDSSIVGILKTIRDRFRTRKKLLLLCMPPSELLDLLKLTGVYSGYQIVEKTSSSLLSEPELPAPEPEDDTARDPAGKADAQPQQMQRKILFLNQSLKRTASLEKGMDSAARCVKLLLPQTPPIAVGYSFAFFYKSSEKVGGDFFDFIQVSDSVLGVVVGDVSGHGIDAALRMGITKKVIQLRARDPDEASPGTVLRRTNRDFVGDFNRNSFVTVLYGTLDLGTGVFTYARAGHEMPIIFGPKHPALAIPSGGIPLGIDGGKHFDASLEEKSLTIPPGGYLFLYTDGLPECWSSRGSCYTRERLQFSVRQTNASLDCQQTLDAILAPISDFAGDRAQEDDMTAILIKRLL